MPYSTSNPPVLFAQGIGGGFQMWMYKTTDDQATVDGANYFTNGGDLGMALHAHVISVDTDAAPLSSAIHMVNATGNGTTDLNNGTAITATDSD